MRLQGYFTCYGLFKNFIILNYDHKENRTTPNWGKKKKESVNAPKESPPQGTEWVRPGGCGGAGQALLHRGARAVPSLGPPAHGRGTSCSQDGPLWSADGSTAESHRLTPYKKAQL